MGNTDSKIHIADKAEAVLLLEQAEYIDQYITECGDDTANFLARKQSNYYATIPKDPVYYREIFTGYLNRIPKQLRDVGDITIVSLMSSADGGMPHTRPPNIICYPNISTSYTTFLHELCHIHQRKFPVVWNTIFAAIGWRPWNGLLPESLDNKRRYNPDTIDTPLWIHGSWVPVPIFRDYTNPVLSEVDIWFYNVEGGHSKTVPDDIVIDMLPPSAYEHPREITAYIISDAEKYQGTEVYRMLRQFFTI